MQSLHSGLLKRGMQVRIPVVPKFHNAQEGLQDRLILVIATRRAERHHRRIALEDQARRERVARTCTWTNLIGSFLVQPKLLAANAHADARVTEDHGTWYPPTTRSDVEDVAVFVDDGNVRGLLRHPRGVLPE